ncbi:hypothetical protein GW17_00016292 [Ensete ventricosum]|nr:hypothetical protein GW17_00016292 [Ensete ventricosum]
MFPFTILTPKKRAEAGEEEEDVESLAHNIQPPHEEEASRHGHAHAAEAAPGARRGRRQGGGAGRSRGRIGLQLVGVRRARAGRDGGQRAGRRRRGAGPGGGEHRHYVGGQRRGEGREFGVVREDSRRRRDGGGLRLERGRLEASSTTTGSTATDDGSKRLLEVNGEVAQLASTESPDEFLSSAKRDAKDSKVSTNPDAGAVGTDRVAMAVDVHGGADASESKTGADESSKALEETSTRGDVDDGESVGEHSADFKEAIFVEEAEEEVAISEEKNSEKAQTVSES